jgi:hypothetical protein
LWEALGILHDMGQPYYEVGTERKNKSKAYSLFVCVGKPIYKRPNDQLVAKGYEVPPAVITMSLDASLKQAFRIGKATLLNFEMAQFIGDTQESDDERKVEAATVPLVPLTTVYSPVVQMPSTVTPAALSAFSHAVTEPRTIQAKPPGPSPSEGLDAIKWALDLYKQWEAKIEFALVLDMQRTPRLDRFGEKEIVIHNRFQATREARDYALSIANKWGWKNPMYTYKERRKLAQAACRQAAFDFGYKKHFSWTRLFIWDKIIQKAIETGDVSMIATK